MLRFFVGLTLAQVAAALLITLYPGAMSFDKLLPLIFMILLLSTIISLWFGTVAKHLSDNRVATLKQQFATEREKLNVNAQRAKTKLVKKTQKEIELQARRTNTKANIKVGTAIAVAAGFGLFMMFTQFVTLGLLTLTTAGGVVGGYLARSRRPETLDSPQYKLIEAEEIESEEIKTLPTPEAELQDTESAVIDISDTTQHADVKTDDKT